VRGLLIRSSELDPGAESAVRVISYFDGLVDAHAGFDALVRSAARLAECAAGLTDSRGRVVARYDANGQPLPREVPDDPLARPYLAGDVSLGRVWLERSADLADPWDIEGHRRAGREAAARNLLLDYPDVAFGYTTIEGPDGHGATLRLRTYRPEGNDDPLPVMLWLHGEAFALGLPEGDDEMCATLVQATECAIVSPEYRLAPEAPFPAALDDAYVTLEWIARRGASHGLRRDRLVVGGASAGGALAAAVCLLSRDRGGPSIVQQMLIYPVLDDRLETASMRGFTDSPVFDRPQAELMWQRYLGQQSGSISPYAAPARMEDLRGLPPTYVLTAGIDPLRDEGIAYAPRLIDAEVPVELHHFPGAFHGFETVAASSRLGQRAFADYAAVLRAAMAD